MEILGNIIFTAKRMFSWMKTIYENDKIRTLKRSHRKLDPMIQVWILCDRDSQLLHPATGKSIAK